jgi:SAM-dependent methyltransferase
MADESEDVIGLYERRGLEFDQVRGRALVEKPWLDKFTSLLPDKASILDIGCGSAEPIAHYFIESGYDVTGVDASSSLIDLCRQRFPQNHWHIADMRQLALWKRFDGLIAWHSLFHLTSQDQQALFDVFDRHASDSATLMFTAGPDHGETIGSLFGTPLYHASLSFEEYEALLGERGFHIVDHVVEDKACGGATVYLARRYLSEVVLRFP